MTTTNSDDPPPYTPTPAFTAGESTLEYGPTSVSASRPQTTTIRSTSLLRQLTDSFNNFVNQSTHNTWPANSFQRQPSLRPPDLVDPSSSSSPLSPPVATSPIRSTFVHDFYAAGTGGDIIQPEFAPPPGPPPRQAEYIIQNSTPDDGRPTTYPAIGHPLLNDGKVLVYPHGYECHKCTFASLSNRSSIDQLPGVNIGYKEADPSRPCNRCWNKYARPFSGPLAYSFSSNTNDGNFQRPLPRPAPVHQRSSIFDPPGAFSSPPQPTGIGPSPRIIRDFPSRPANALVYTAGDPRIGGVLCWRCGGKGQVTFLFLDSITCEVCSGVGRIFH